MLKQRLRKLWHKGRSDESGTIVALVAAAMVVFLGMVALGVDTGRLYVAKQHLAVVADSAVLAGVQALPEYPDQATALVREYLQKNGLDPTGAEIQVTEDMHQISVRMQEIVPMTFAKAIGTVEVNVTGGAGAWVSYLSGVYGASPMGIPQANWTVGELVYLKVAPPTDTASPGNYQALALGDGGASAYEANLMYGFNQWLRVGQWVPTEPGNIAGPTVKAVQYLISQDPYATYETVKRDSPRLLKVPILASATVNGRGEVNVIGFGVFFLESGISTGDDKGEIRGRFVRANVEGEGALDVPDFGAHVVKLKH